MCHKGQRPTQTRVDDEGLAARDLGGEGRGGEGRKGILNSDIVIGGVSTTSRDVGCSIMPRCDKAQGTRDPPVTNEQKINLKRKSPSSFDREQALPSTATTTVLKHIRAGNLIAHV